MEDVAGSPSSPPSYAAVTSQPLGFAPGKNIMFDTWIRPPHATDSQDNAVISGLETLSLLDQINIDQIVDPIEVAINMDMRKKYVISDSQSQVCYKVEEESSLAMLICCQEAREFKMHVKDINNKDVLVAHRPFKHCLGCVALVCCPCCGGNAQRIEVISDGRLIASAVEMVFCSRNQLEIMDESGQALAVLAGPSCMPCNCSKTCCKDIDFQIMTPDMSTQLGQDFRWFEVRHRKNKSGDSD